MRLAKSRYRRSDISRSLVRFRCSTKSLYYFLSSISSWFVFCTFVTPYLRFLIYFKAVSDCYLTRNEVDLYNLIRFFDNSTTRNNSDDCGNMRRFLIMIFKFLFLRSLCSFIKRLGYYRMKNNPLVIDFHTRVFLIKFYGIHTRESSIRLS